MKTLYLFILAIAVVFTLSACGETTPPPAPQSSSDSSAPTSEMDSANDTAKPVGLAGSHGTDIRMSLTGFGLEEATISSAPEEAQSVYAYSCSTSYADEALGVSYDYALTMDGDYQIIGATFGIWNDGLISNDDFISAAKTYLGYCATTPYGSADASTARPWAEDNSTAAIGGDEVFTTIGDAKFELSGAESNGIYTFLELRISAVTAE